MKKIILLAITLLSSAQLYAQSHHHCQTRSEIYISGYHPCGTPIYCERVITGYHPCGSPIYYTRTIPDCRVSSYEKIRLQRQYNYRYHSLQGNRSRYQSYSRHYRPTYHTPRRCR